MRMMTSTPVVGRPSGWYRASYVASPLPTTMTLPLGLLLGLPLLTRDALG